MSSIRNYRITAVKTAAASFSLTTLANVKADLNITVGTDDVYLGRLIKMVSGAVTNYCNRVFALQTYTETFRPTQDGWPGTLLNKKGPLSLRWFPVRAINSITLKDAASTVLTTDDYEFDGDTGEVWRLNSNGDPTGWDAYGTVIEYQAGWTLPGGAGAHQLTDEAADIEDVVISAIKGKYLSRERDDMLKLDTMAGVGTQEYWIATGGDGNFTPDEQGTLNNYRIPVVA